MTKTRAGYLSAAALIIGFFFTIGAMLAVRIAARVQHFVDWIVGVWQ